MSTVSDQSEQQLILILNYLEIKVIEYSFKLK